MRHTALKKLVALVGGFTEAGGGRSATIPGTHQPAKVGRRYQTLGHPIGDVAVIELLCNAPGRVPRASIPYLWIFEGASKEEVRFRPSTYYHQ